MKQLAETRPQSSPIPCMHPAFLPALLALVVFILYWPATGFEFTHYDDPTYYVQNTRVQAGLSWDGIVWAFTTGTASNWHPVTWISHMVDADLSGRVDPEVPHFTNILLHAANSALLFLLLNKLTGTRWRSLFVAGLFALHPLNVESVAWISERKNVLSTLFWLLTLVAYVRFATKKGIGPAANAHWRDKNYLLALGLFALGLMSKPMLVTLPFTLLLLDYWPLKRTPDPGRGISDWKSLIAEKLPFFVLSVVFCIVTFLVQQHGKAVQTLEKFPAEVRLENALASYLRYLGKAFWPANLAVDYPHPGRWPATVVLTAALLLLAISLLALRRTQNRWLFAGWFWFLGTLVPVIGLVQVGVQSMADRYAYIPLIGIFTIVTWGVFEILDGLKFPRTTMFIAATIILAACAAQTRHQLNFWRNDGLLFGHSLAVTTNNAHAHVTLGVYLDEAGDKSGALQHYQAALVINPDDMHAHYNLGNVLNFLGKPDDAIKEYREAIRVAPEYSAAHYNLGNVLDDIGKPDDAIKEYREAIRVDPTSYVPHYNLGLLLERLGRRNEAIEELKAALKDNPNFEAARQHLLFLGGVAN